MQVVHEFGHVILAIASGGQVEKVILHPLTFSRTYVSVNPHPLAQVWAGPIIGVILPILTWVGASLIRTAYLPLFRFFAGFCCIANGAYIGFGPDSIGLDTQVMLSLGCRRWQLMLFGVTMLGLGFLFLNGTGKEFGIGIAGGEVSQKLMRVSACLFVAIVGVELIVNII